MKVKDLIDKLKEFPVDMPVWICDEVEGNDYELTCLSIIKDGGYDRNQPQIGYDYPRFDVVLLRGSIVNTRVA